MESTPREEALIALFPRLFHMCEADSWTAIRDHGLLSTSALLDLYGIAGERRAALESRRRDRVVRIEADGLPGAVLRDQKPLTDAALTRCLSGGLTPRQWYEMLNARVFFWLSEARLAGLLAARSYRARPHAVLVLSTRSLIQRHRAAITLSPINSGAAVRRPQPRGPETFLPIADYPLDLWRAKRRAADSVVELCVERAVKDIAAHLLAVHRVEEGRATPLWRHPDTGTTGDLILRYPEAR
ncbi:DUF7002 family protein [Consotaella salsifontis]|uniref:Uncharacterized protein n=1 Tax=Consotaella salsifontis TaxID=1365950 RepID=A0A1T4QTU3_9HYPH|nr:hypothetical protein [Consotaella salsifontis]SKA07096.1 hypothetical protein SAMN05428963_105251 [Consotaella salsifontis]